MSKKISSVRKRLIERDGLTCWICESPIDLATPKDTDEALTLDHYHPRSRGGGNGIDNLRLAHRICNSHRGNPVIFHGD